MATFNCVPRVSRTVSISCQLCGGRQRRGIGRYVIPEEVPNNYSRQCWSWMTQSRRFSVSGLLMGKKKDYYKEDKLPIFDYGKIHTERKRIYVFGQASHGGLGLPNIFEHKLPGEDRRQRLYMHRPVRHFFGGLHDVKDIATGHGFTLIAIKQTKDSSPVIFGCGYNDKSQLGFQPNRRDQPLMCLISVVPLSLPLDKTSKILALGAGRAHSLISVAGKGLISLGDNSNGQCGRMIIPDEEYHGSKFIYRIPPLGSSHDYDVVDITSRFDLSILLTRMGKVYTFGCNMQGQLGRGKDVLKPWIPEEVQGDLKGVTVTKVATSGSSVLAISDKGELFGWGSNDCGQINPETSSNNYYEPTHIKLPRRVGRIRDVALGDMFTFVLNQYGNVYVWGTGASLGLGPKNMAVKTPTLMPPPLFGRNEFSQDTAVVKIVSSFKYSAAVNSVGDLYTWGLSDNGNLGLGKLHKHGDYQYFPFKVALGGAVHKVCLGADHTVVLTKGGH